MSRVALADAGRAEALVNDSLFQGECGIFMF